MRRDGAVLRRFALVILTVVGIAGAAVVVPAAADAATAYFSTVKTVKVAIDLTNDTANEIGWKTAWCPTGYRVTGGGFDLLNPWPPNGLEIRGSTPTANSSGRQGWRILLLDTQAGGSQPPPYVYAQCVR